MEHPLIRLEDIPAAGAATVDFFGREVLVYLVDGQPRATANVCTHLGGPLDTCEGQFVCAWHGATFDLTTGDRRSGPARPNTKLMHLPTKIADGQLLYVWNSDTSDPSSAAS
jgi:nitrite reductase/ring-hydroxylating ferredoxin subunit